MLSMRLECRQGAWWTILSFSSILSSFLSRSIWLSWEDISGYSHVESLQLRFMKHWKWLTKSIKEKNSKVGPVWGPSSKVVLFLSEDTRFGPILDPIEVHFGPAFFFDYFWKWLLMMQKIAKIRFHQLFLFINKFQAIYFFTHIVLASLDESIRSDCKLFQNDFTFRLSL